MSNLLQKIGGKLKYMFLKCNYPAIMESELFAYNNYYLKMFGWIKNNLVAAAMIR